ncbi:hypothetical protein [Streptomyces yangpuensis]|uniref:hypothetical protein n=1 Tax=Streptomyces yangpuensis TaxID=1648182 RepID=UPI00367EFA01
MPCSPARAASRDHAARDHPCGGPASGADAVRISSAALPGGRTTPGCSGKTSSTSLRELPTTTA